VIRSLNEDLPWNQFLSMQLAGDLLEPDTLNGAAASGFLVAGPYPGQITAKTVERIRYDQLDDMLMTIGGSMLGLTLGCVRCHDHKYDPIPQQDYYAIASSLARTVHGTKTYDYDPATTAQREQQHRSAHEALLATLNTFATDQLPARFATWRKDQLPSLADAPRWQILDPTAVDAERSWLKSLPGGLIAHDGQLVPGSSVPQRGRRRNVANEERYELRFLTHQKNLQSLRLDIFTEKSLPQKGPGLNGDGSFQLAEIKLTSRSLNSTDAPVPTELKLAFAAFADDNQPASQALDNKPNTAWVVRTTAKKDNCADPRIRTAHCRFRKRYRADSDTAVPGCRHRSTAGFCFHRTQSGHLGGQYGGSARIRTASHRCCLSTAAAGRAESSPRPLDVAV
jgi:hypothetical protein